MIKNVALFFKNIIDWANNERSIFSYLVEALKVTNNNIKPIILAIILQIKYNELLPFACIIIILIDVKGSIA